MKVGALKELLKLVDDDIEIVLFADHGQTLMKWTGSGYSFVEDLGEYMMDEADFECGEVGTKVFVLEAV